ncbi:hypothetical protein [Paractinoplanes durhamensis]|uniref:GNAT family N-acetyltransferase n=1 Tax=Paractinoplanes durhamensis TaxID=113563 RepID=A0ABQ3Z8F2_9ACTN|nr:hypothetical protein [Actinoplanes durhamensis]GIE06100.1 hypothetical protein Adu01nite_74500 [Actinoplanes durhamensis]
MSYDLDEPTVRQRTAAALAAHPSTGSRFVALAVSSASPMADVARTLERQVFEESFGNDAGQMAAEYRRYEDDSLFFIVLDRRTGMPAGAARVIDGGGKTLDDAPERIGTSLSAIVTVHNLVNGRIWDFATLAVRPAYRGGRSGLTVSTLLYRTFLNAGRLAGVRHLVAMLDHRAHRNLKLIGVRFEPMAGSAPFEYLGSPSTEALYTPFAELIPSIARQAGRLRTPGGDFHGEIRARGLRRLLTRRIAARVAGRIATGDGLDEHITLPGLDRRQLMRQR